MTQNDPVKTRIRTRIAVTNEGYAKAQRLLRDYPEPTPEAIAAADALDKTYDTAEVSLYDRMAAAAMLRTMLGSGAPIGAAPDTYQHAVPGFFGPNQERTEPKGEIALIARPEFHDGQPALALECVGVTQSHGKHEGAWLTCLGFDLQDRGFKYDAVGGTTTRWRVELAPDADDHCQPVGVRVHDGAGWTLFDGKALLPPGWIVRAQIDPVGLLVVAGPLSDDIPFPQPLEERLDALFGWGAVIAARMLVDVTPRRQAPRDGTAPRSAGPNERPDGNPFDGWGIGRFNAAGEIPLDLLVQNAITGCVDDGISEHAELLCETLDGLGIDSWKEAGSLLMRYMLNGGSYGRGPQAAEKFLASTPIRPDLPANATWIRAVAEGLRDGPAGADAVLEAAEDVHAKGAVRYMLVMAIVSSGFPRSEHDALMGALLDGVL